MAESLGDFLKRERETRQISLQDLSKAIHVSVPLLNALEGSRFEYFSQREYITGYLRLYSRHLGLEEDAVMRRFDEDFNRLHAKDAGKEDRPFLNFNSPLHQAGGSSGSALQRPGKLVKNAALVFIVILGISILFYFPGEIKGPEVNRTPVTPTTVAEAPRPPAAPKPVSPIAPDAKSADTPQVVAKTQAPAPAATASRTAAAVPEAKKAVNSAGKVIGNSDSKRYHLPGMKYYHAVKAFHRVEFDSEADAIRAGYHKAPR